MITQKTLNTLEFHKIKEKLAQYCVNEDAKILSLEIQPCDVYDSVLLDLDRTEEADKILFKHTADPIAVYDKLNNILEKASVMSVLNLSEILKVSRLLRASRILLISVSAINDNTIVLLRQQCNRIYSDIGFEKEVDRCILSEDEIADTATDALYSIRKKIRKCNDDIKEKLLNMTHSADMSKYLQDNIVTMRSGRYVIPVKQEFRGQVSGLIHDQSSTGATVFIEPMAVVESNNQLKSLYLEEQLEIERILKGFTAKVNGIHSALAVNIQVLTACDLSFAKAKFARTLRAVKPVLNSQGVLDIKRGRHPLIDSKNVVPVSIRLGEEFRLLVITGPNTGGKTVTLKLAGLFCIMAMCGLFLPSDEGSRVSIFHHIFCDIGDEQSIEQSLSTFSSHIRNIAEITKKLDKDTLVLFDELGAGTDPAEGSALALAITEYLLKTECKGIITTHYGELKEYSMIHEGIENASMEFNPETFAPTYKLNIGIAGSSNAIEIANRLSLNPLIVDRARQFVSKEKLQMENVLQKAELARYQSELAKEEIEVYKREYQEKLKEISEEKSKLANMREMHTKNAKIEAKQIISRTVGEAQEIVTELKNLLSSDELTEESLFTARQLKKRIENLKYSDDLKTEDTERRVTRKLKDDEIKIGLNVFVEKLKTVGTVMDISTSRKECQIQVGNLSTMVNYDQLFEAVQEKASTKKTVISYQSSIGNKSAVSEIKLLGKTVDEALPLVDDFLDNAYMSGMNEVKIIHGIGTGVLMRAVQGHLKSYPLVEEYRYGKYGEGERGVTIVKLKKK